MKKLKLLSTLILASVIVSAQIIHVPGDQPTIQAGIDAATTGDTVLVAEGTYFENINFKGKAITVASHFILNGQTPVAPGALVAHWLFNGDGNDASGNGHDGTASAGHANWGGGMPEPAEDRHGNADYCYKFVEGGNFVVPNAPAFIPPELTISVWMKLYETWAHSYFISNDIWHTWKFQVQDADKPFFTAHILKDDGSGDEAWIDYDSNTGILELDTWHHVVLTYTSGKMIFYIDGENVQEWDDFPTGTLIPPHEGIDLCIGQALPTKDFDNDEHEWHEWLGYFKGWLDDMRFYNVVLTDAEVKTLYDYEKDNTITDPDYISNTIIDGSQAKNSDSASVVYFISGEDYNSVLQGFTITNGLGTYIPEDEASSGGGIFCTNSSPVLSNLIIDGNQSYLAGGILCEFSDLKIFNSSIINNKMFCEVGGGMICLSSNPFLQNVVIDNNTADWGGGIYLEESDGYFIDVQFTNNERGIGAGMLCSFNSDPTIINSTFTDNIAVYGGGIACINNSNPVLINSILWNNSPEEVFFADEWPPNSISISYSDVEGGEEGIVTSDNGTVNWLEGNIDEDPLFANTGSYPYSLTNGSPCVNYGNPDTVGLNLPETDLASAARIYGNRIDMGAYENQDLYVRTVNPSAQTAIMDVTAYPNPFFTSIILSYKLTKPSIIQINIYNHLGELVDAINRTQSQGKQTVVWDAEGLPSGVYYCVLRTKSGTQTIKMIKLK